MSHLWQYTFKWSLLTWKSALCLCCRSSHQWGSYNCVWGLPLLVKRASLRSSTFFLPATHFVSFKCPFIDEQLAVQSCVSLTKLFLVRKIATSSPAFEKCTTIIFFSEKFLWKHERVVFAKIFVRIEITEQKSSPTKTSSLIKIFGWSIFENTVKHARKKRDYPSRLPLAAL